MAASAGELLIFCNEAAEPTPIETDAVLKVSAFHQYAKRGYLSTSFCFAFLSLFKIFIFLLELRYYPLGIILGNTRLCSLLCYILLFICSAGRIGQYHHWHRRAKTAAKTEGRFIQMRPRPAVQLVPESLILLVVSMLLSGYGGSIGTALIFAGISLLLGMTVIAVILRAFAKKRKPAA